MMSKNAHHREWERDNDVEYDHDRQLPTETLCLIFRRLPPSSLSAICMVSHRTRAIVEPILYRSPHADSPPRVLLLVRTLLGRPELMRHVRSISLNLDGADAGDGLGIRYLPSLLRNVKTALEEDKMKGLRELVWCARGETGWALPSSPAHLPRITHFSTTAATPSLPPFLTTHPSITHLTLHSHGLALRLPPHALPRLTHVACAAPALSGLPVRKLKHVVLMDAPFIPLMGGGVLSVLGSDRDRREFTRGWRDASPSPAGDQLEAEETEKPLRSITLRLGHVMISPLQAPFILEPFVRHVPSLKKLGIVAGPSFFTREVLVSLTSTLEGFTELTSICLECNTESKTDNSLGAGCISPALGSEGTSFGGGSTPLTEEFYPVKAGYHPLGEGASIPTADETRAIIRGWKDACPSLESVRLPWWVPGGGGEGDEPIK